jgi:hypothetical protein
LTSPTRKASQILEVVEKNDAIVAMFLDWPYNTSNLVISFSLHSNYYSILNRSEFNILANGLKFKDALGLDA